MNQTISTFMKIAITVAAIGILVFGTAYAMIQENTTGTNGYQTEIQRGDTHLPAGH